MADSNNSREVVADFPSHGTSNGLSPQNIMLKDQEHLNVTDTEVKSQHARINVTKNISFDSNHNKKIIRAQSIRGRRIEIGGRLNRDLSHHNIENRIRPSSEFGDSSRQFGSRMGRCTSMRGRGGGRRGRGRFDMRPLRMNPNKLGHTQRIGSISPRRGLSPREIPPPPPPAPQIVGGYFNTPTGTSGRGHNQLQINYPVSYQTSISYREAYLQHQPVPMQQQHSLPLQHYPPRQAISNTSYHPTSGSIHSQSLIGYYQFHHLHQSQKMEDTQNTMDGPNAIASNWSIHTAPSGVDYYYNSVTRMSTYRRPSCLGLETNKANHGSNTSFQWTKHVDPKSGKTYYFNGVSTTWNNPFDFKDDDHEQLKTESDNQFLTKKIKTEQSQDINVVYKNKVEAVSAFKDLLLEKGIVPNLKWNEVQKVCCVDKRWEALRTIGERKQALAEYQTKRANDLKEEKRQEKVRAKDRFMQMLTEKLTSIATFTGIETDFEDIRDHLVRDERFFAFDQERDREDIYKEFIEEVQKRDERKRDENRRNAKASLVSFLEDREKIGASVYTSTWDEFVSSLSAEEEKDNRFSQASMLRDSEKQEILQEFIQKKQDAERARVKRIHDAKIKLERAQRDDFVKALIRLAKESKILPFSRWRNCEDFLLAEDAYRLVRDQDKNTPRDLFENFVDQWYDNYRKERIFLHSIVVPTKLLTDGANTKYSEFSKNLIDVSQSSYDTYLNVRDIINRQEPVSTAKLLFDELTSKLKKGPHVKRMNDDSSESDGEIIEDNDGRE
jgi:pre-mRNA-processing factor 40